MLGFGAGFVLTQFGLRWMLSWVGVAISIPTSTLLFWCLAPFFVDPGGGSLKAVVLFACVGLFFPGAAALLNFESNRLMGPNIAGGMMSSSRLIAFSVNGIPPRKSGSHETLRWREVDSNHRSRVRKSGR